MTRDITRGLVIIAFLLAFSIDPGDSILLLPLPDLCKFSHEVSYFTGINEARVSIQSNLSHPYPPNVDCTLHIVETGTNAGVRLSWTYFDMRPADGSKQCQDYVELSKMDPVTNKMIVLLSATCGSEAPPNTTQDVNDVMLRVKTSSSQGTNMGFMLLYRKYRAAVEVDAITQPPIDSAVVAGVTVGSILVFTLLVLFALCIICALRHKRDLLKPKDKKPYNGYERTPRDVRAETFLRSFNPPPQPQPAPLRLPRAY